MKIVYILAALMFIGIFLIVICSFRVLNEMNAVQRPRFHPIRPHQQTQKPEVKPTMLPFVIGTYLGLTFFIVGAIGSVIAVVQVGMRRF